MSYHTPEHKIVVPEQSTLESIHQAIEEGGQFIVFLYCFSFLVISFRRYSPAILIKSSESINDYKKKYNKISYWLGWWAVPYGIGNTLACIKFNNNNGLDVTEDIMLNLNEESLQSGIVKLKTVYTIFAKPEGDELQMLQKAFKEKMEHNVQINELIVGYFLNADIDERPFYAVGIRTTGNFDKVHRQVEKAIRKIFFRQTDFQFVDLNEKTEFVEKLIEQGEKFI